MPYSEWAKLCEDEIDYEKMIYAIVCDGEEERARNDKAWHVLSQIWWASPYSTAVLTTHNSGTVVINNKLHKHGQKVELYVKLTQSCVELLFWAAINSQAVQVWHTACMIQGPTWPDCCICTATEKYRTNQPSESQTESPTWPDWIVVCSSLWLLFGIPMVCHNGDNNANGAPVNMPPIHQGGHKINCL